MWFLAIFVDTNPCDTNCVLYLFHRCLRGLLNGLALSGANGAVENTLADPLENTSAKEKSSDPQIDTPAVDKDKGKKNESRGRPRR
jgi:hypothetical protein